jgi:hypothetical protein
MLAGTVSLAIAGILRQYPTTYSQIRYFNLSHLVKVRPVPDLVDIAVHASSSLIAASIALQAMAIAYFGVRSVGAMLGAGKGAVANVPLSVLAEHLGVMMGLVAFMSGGGDALVVGAILVALSFVLKRGEASDFDRGVESVVLSFAVASYGASLAFAATGLLVA